MALRHHLPKFPPRRSGAVSCFLVDIGLMDNNVPYYLDEGPPPTNAVKGREEEEVSTIDP